MDFSADIKFSRNLIKNENATITYSGYLYKNNSDAVTMVYGFGDNWENTTEKQMEKTTKGFVTKINLLNFNKLNFCFRNSNYEWDNNNNQNYVCPIESSSATTKENIIEEADDAFIINENMIGGILTNLFETNLSELKDTPSTYGVVDEIKIDDVSDEVSTAAGIKIEDVFDTMFGGFTPAETSNPTSNYEIIEDTENYIPLVDENIKSDIPQVANEILEDTKNYVPLTEENIETNNSVDKENIVENFGDLFEVVTENVPENYTSAKKTDNETPVLEIPKTVVDEKPIEEISVSEENVETSTESEETSFFVDIEKDESVNIEDSFVNSTVESNLNKQIEKSFDDIYLGEDYSDKQNLLTDILSEPDTIKKEVKKFDMDGLINEILSPVIKSSNFIDNCNRITVEENPDNTYDNESTENTNCSELIETIDKKFEELQEASLIEDALNNKNITENIESLSKEDISSSSEKTTALATVKEDNFVVSPRSLGTFYMIRKKIKLIFYKIFGILPRLLFDYEDEK